MTIKKPKNAETGGVYKKQEFEAYATWRAMPSFLRGQPRGMLERFGIDDDLAMSLLEIRNQTEFAKKFGIKDLTTLSEWNKKIDEMGLMTWINGWARKLTPNVISALYKSITKDGKAGEVKAWMEIVEGQ